MPPAPAAASILKPSLPTAVAAAKLIPSPAAWTRAFATSSAQTLPPRRAFAVSSSRSATAKIKMTATPAFAAAANADKPAKGGRGVFSGLPSWRPRRLSSLAPPRIRRRPLLPASAPPSVASSSASDDSFVEGAAAPRPPRRRYSASPPAAAAGAEAAGGSRLSSARARAAVGLLPSYLLDARAIAQYSPSTPEGALQLSVAENQLCELPVRGLVGIEEPTRAGGIFTKGTRELRLVDVLSRLASSNIARPSDERAQAMHAFETDMVYYQPTQGIPSVRAAMADYLQDLLVAPTRPALKGRFDPDGVVLGAGCNAVLENLCAVLADPGDAVMIPTPYYAAFEFDLVARAGCHITPVDTLDHQERGVPREGPIPAAFYYPNRSSLDAAYARAVGETGRPPRVLLLSHPNNPLGVCYPPAVVEECIDWCREREVHLVSDEIYAGSVYRKERADGEATFVSAMALGADGEGSAGGAGLGLGPFVHLVYALSKDFALSGLRVGVAYTENEEILMPLQKLNDLCQISSQTQLLVERMVSANAVSKDGVEPRKFVDAYLEANARNIRERCDALQSCLDDVGIPYLPADSGLFVWMDLREFLPPLPGGTTEATESVASRERRERELYLSLMKEHGLLFTPGMSMRNGRAGFFRCVFTAASEGEFELGLARLRKFVEAMRS